MGKLTVKKWGKFQHYKDRRPPWIKLYRDLLDNQDFMCLPIASKALAPCLWLIASESEIGEIDGDIKKLAWRLRMTEKEVRDGLKPLIENGFFIVASNMLADGLHDAIPERERETETEKKVDVSASQKPSPNGTRLPTDWKPTQEGIDYCKIRRPDLDVEETIEAFRDWWLSVPGAKGVKLDWDLTWKTWVRNEKTKFGNRKAGITSNVDEMMQGAI